LSPLSLRRPLLDNLKIGYDNNADDDIDDVGDDLVVNETFTNSYKSISYDYAGNLIDDGVFQYVYDAWNRLIKVRSSVGTARTFQTANFDGLGRRMKKAVTNSGDQDATVVYLYDGQKIIQANDGSGNMVQQFIHGTQYIDELVMVRVANKGDLYVHQDANWNVIGLTDLGHHLVEHYKYTPYGELTVDQDTGYGDRDGDGIVNSTDKGTVGVTCTGTVSGACRILDLDFDGDYDSTDATKFDSLPSGSQKRPGKQSTGVAQPFAHQGLLFEPEIASYQNRARQYDPAKRRFDQRDPIAFLRSRFNARDDYRDGTHQYVYVIGSPTSRVDPTGLTGACDQCTTDEYGCDYYICRESQTVNADMQIYYQTAYIVCTQAPSTPGANAYRKCLQVCDQDDCPNGSCGLITSGAACHLGCL